MSPLVELKRWVYNADGKLLGTEQRRILDVPDIDGSYATDFGELSVEIINNEEGKITGVILDAEFLKGQRRSEKANTRWGKRKRLFSISNEGESYQKIDATTTVMVKTKSKT